MKQLKTISLDIDWAILPNLVKLIIPFSKAILKIKFPNNEQYILIIVRRFGLHGGVTQTLDEIGRGLGITRERVRQIESSGLKKIALSFKGKDPTIQVPNLLVEEGESLVKSIQTSECILTQSEAVQFFTGRYGEQISANELVAINFLFKVLGFSPLDNKKYKLGMNIHTSWLIDQKRLIDQGITLPRFYDLRNSVDQILKKKAISLNLELLTGFVNIGRKPRIKPSMVDLACKTWAEIEKTEQGLYQMRFSELKSDGDRAHRILFEQNKLMNASEIAIEINHRMALAGEKTSTTEAYIINEMSKRKKIFKNVGKGAGWGLMNWGGLTKKYVVDWMREYLFTTKTPATAEELFEFVVKNRPDVSIKSIRSFLSQPDKFTKVLGTKTYVPADWPNYPKSSKLSNSIKRSHRTSSKRNCVSQLVLKYISEEPDRRIKRQILKQKIVKECQCEPSTFYRYLSEMDTVKVELLPDGDYCVLTKTSQVTIDKTGTELDCILIVAVTKIEVQAVHNIFVPSGKLIRKPIGNKTYYDLGTHKGVPIYMVQSEMGTSTPGRALSTTKNAISDIHPSAIILVGIAFGLKPTTSTNPNGQKLGDILVSKQIMAYEPGKVKGKFKPRGDRVTSSTRLLDKFRSGELDWGGAPVHFGLILSGEKLVNDSKFCTRLLSFEPEAIGGEMEGAGLYAAASENKVDWILVKAICDWADGNKNDAAQDLAAQNAAKFAYHVLSLGG